MIKKIEKLQEVKEKLKSDFVGIDEIIDKVIENITPWYITPQILERPVIVSLWGLTGTGKTSLVRKLIEYLDVLDRTIFFDCGESDNPQKDSLTDDIINRFFNASSYACPGHCDIPIDTAGTKESVFVFDEFQYARTIDQEGNELEKHALRPIWNLVDSGILDVNEYSNYDLTRLYTILDNLKGFTRENPGCGCEGGCYAPETTRLPVFKKSLGVLYKSYEYEYDDDPIPDEEEERKNKSKEKKRRILAQGMENELLKRLNRIRYGYGFEALEKLDTLVNLDEYASVLAGYVKELKKPLIFDASRSLIFILGNLDEAFSVHSEIDPDISADLFHDITEAVGITELKEALQRKFRAEQVGRLGNNIIKYPSLRCKDFETIIDRELGRIGKRYKELTGIEIEYTKKLKTLVYSEGVYPVQGVRPVITTIGSMINPRLTDILIEKPEGTVKVILDVPDRRLDKDTVTIRLRFLGEGSEELKVSKKSIDLSLGKLRDPESCDKIVAHSVHEASHAVLYSALTGEFPRALVSISSMGGGYMWNEVSDQTHKSADSNKELDNNIIVALAGYYGEHEFFDEPHCLLGSSSDLDDAWSEFSEAVYKCGYFKAFIFTEGAYNPQSPDHTPLGIHDTTEITGEVPGDKTIKNLVLSKFIELQDKTKEMVKAEKVLIAEIAKYLSKNRSMSVAVYKKYISKYAKTFGLAEMKKLREQSGSYWSDALKKALG
jgi:cell division protease FtsH